MRRTAALIAALAVLAFVPPAFARDAAAPAASVPKDEDKLICKRIKETGTRIGGERVCHTAAQWKEMNRAAEEAARAMTSKRVTSMRRPSEAQ